MISDIDLRLSRCFHLVFPALEPAEVADASSETVDDWDSVAAVTLLSLVEEEFGVTVEPDMLMADRPFEALRDHLQSVAV